MGKLFNINICTVTFVLVGIEQFAESHRRSLTVNKGDTAIIECLLPHSNPPALPRYRIRGKWLEQSSGTDKKATNAKPLHVKYNETF